MALAAGNGDAALGGSAGLGIFGLRGGSALQVYVIGGNGAGTGYGAAAVHPEHAATNGNELSAAGDGALIQFNGGAALGVNYGAFAAVNGQHCAVCQSQSTVLNGQAGLTDFGAAGIALNEDLTLYGDIAGHSHNRRCSGAVNEIAVGQIVGMGVDGGILQGGAVCHPQLSADGGAGEELAIAIVIIVHGEGTAGLDVNDALYHGIPERQLAAVFHNDANAAENLHVDQCEIAAGGNVEGLRDISCLDLIPLEVVAQIAIGAALVGAVPGLEILGDTDGIFLPIHIAAKLGDGPGLHDIPHVLAVLGLGQIVQRDPVSQLFRAGIDAEGEGVADGSAALIVGDCHGDQVAARILGGTAEGQAAADGGPEGAAHAAVGSFSGACFGVGHNGNNALCDIAGAGVSGGVQLFPVGVSGGAALFCPGTVYGDIAVLVGSGCAGGTGNTVIVLLTNNGGLKIALDLNVKLVGIALTVIFHQRGIAVGVDEQLYAERLIAFGGDGDHIAALQDGNRGGGAEILYGEYQTAVFRVLLVAAAAGGGIALGFPDGIVDGELSDGVHITVGILYGDIPVIAEGILAQRKLLHRNGLQGDLFEYGGDGHIAGRHLEGTAGVSAGGIHLSAVRLCNGDAGKGIAVVGGSGDSDGLACLGGLRGDGDTAVFTASNGDRVGHGGGIDYGGSVVGLVQGQRQILIAIGGDHAGGGINIVVFADHEAKRVGISVVAVVIPHAEGAAALLPSRTVDTDAGDGGDKVLAAAGKCQNKVCAKVGGNGEAGGRRLLFTGIGCFRGLRVRLRGLRAGECDCVAAAGFCKGQGDIGIIGGLDDYSDRAAGKALCQQQYAVLAGGAAGILASKEGGVTGKGKRRAVGCFCVLCSIYRYGVNSIQPACIIAGKFQLYQG